MELALEDISVPLGWVPDSSNPTYVFGDACIVHTFRAVKGHVSLTELVLAISEKLSYASISCVTPSFHYGDLLREEAEISIHYRVPTLEERVAELEAWKNQWNTPK